MKITIIPRHTPRTTVVSIRTEHTSSDSLTTNMIGEAITETLCDFMNFTKDKLNGQMTVDLPNRQAVRDWLTNSQSRDSVNEAKDALNFVIDRLPHIRTRADKDAIADVCKSALKRIRW